MLTTNYFNKLIIILIIFTFNFLHAKQINKAIFELNNQIYSNIDVERRIEYIAVINNIDISDFSAKDFDNILQDYVSSLIFFEYKKDNNFKYENLEEEINDFYIRNKFESNVSKISSKNESLKNNIKIDLVRKRIIENLINSKKEKLNKETQLLDLIYKYKFNYIIIKEENLDKISIKTINNLNEFIKFKDFLSNNSISFLYKEEEILDKELISDSLKSMINDNRKSLIEKNEKYLKIIFLDKNLESYENIFVKLVSFETNKELDTNDLNCESIIKNDDKIVFREFEYSKLNDKTKKSLKSINDYMLLKNGDKFNYVFLCELNYDQNFLNQIDFNKKVQNLANKLENEFLIKYKNHYNFKKYE